MARTAQYVQRIERALARIESGAATGDWPSLAQLAQAAAMSEFHFHRIYRILTGETPQTTLSRARVGGSLPVLTGPDGIMGATDASAYATSQSYARALKSLTGATASQLRADPELFAKVSAQIMQPANPDGVMAVEIVELSPLKLAAARAVGDFSDLNHGFFHLFELVLEQIAPDQVTGIYGIPLDDPRHTPAELCRFDCAITASANIVPLGDLKLLQIGGGSALRLRLEGDYDNVHAALDHLYGLAIALDLELASELPLNFYHNDPEETPEEELLADIHLKLAE